VNGVTVIPANHNVTGTCGDCGGAIICPMLWSGNPFERYVPDERCMDCGKRPKIDIMPNFGKIRPMNP
jgi:hypothetical protein